MPTDVRRELARCQPRSGGCRGNPRACAADLECPPEPRLSRPERWGSWRAGLANTSRTTLKHENSSKNRRSLRSSLNRIACSLPQGYCWRSLSGIMPITDLVDRYPNKIVTDGRISGIQELPSPKKVWYSLQCPFGPVAGSGVIQLVYSQFVFGLNTFLGQ